LDSETVTGALKSVCPCHLYIAQGQRVAFVVLASCYSQKTGSNWNGQHATLSGVNSYASNYTI
jgi:hypothetical protein